MLRCSAVEGDGLGSHDLNDGGVLGTVMAAGFKGKRILLSPNFCMLSDGCIASMLGKKIMIK